MKIPSQVTAHLSVVEFCCDFHRRIYEHKLTAMWMEETLGDRPCLLCDAEDVIATGCHVPGGQKQLAGSPELVTAFYKLCEQCYQRGDMMELVEHALQLEIFPPNSTVH